MSYNNPDVKRRVLELLNEGFTYKEVSKQVNKTEYDVYLLSPEWADVIQAVKTRANSTCERCLTYYPEKANTHHRTYKHKFDEMNNLSCLSYLCPWCHTSAHDLVDGGTRTKPGVGDPLRKKIDRLRLGEIICGNSLEEKKELETLENQKDFKWIL